jgi:AraC-like DNA-binding protein
MDNHYLIGQILSTDDFSESLEYIIPDSEVKSKGQSDKFKSVGDGVISKGFFLGQNQTEKIAKIQVRDFNSFVFSMPLKGHYSTQLSHKHFHDNTPVSGSMFFPMDTIQYFTDADVVNDIMLIVEYDQLEPILKRNYHIQDINEAAYVIEKRNPKVQALYDLIVHNLSVLRIYPNLRESLHFTASIKEVAKLLFAELIADSLNARSRSNNSPDSFLLKKAEELMEANPERYFGIQEIADQLNTSPRNLQLAFKKHRGQTPMQFLRERKLHRARSLLISKDSDLLIKSVAFDSGFLNGSSFSKYYQDLFGELPSETLLKAK